MGRWQPDAQGRLQQAALELFGERGFEATTVDAIAERAGLTKRTFFRYFADKREVLFSRSSELHDLFLATIEGAPKSASPMQAVALALDAVGKMFEARRPHSARRQQIINANTELQERELIKLASLTAVMAAALRARGVGDPAAGLTAEAGMAVFRIGFEQWVAESNERTFTELMRTALAELRAVTAA